MRETTPYRGFVIIKDSDTNWHIEKEGKSIAFFKDPDSNTGYEKCKQWIDSVLQKKGDR